MTKFKRFSIISFLLVLALITVACSSDKVNNQSSETSSGYPLTIQDFMGRKVVIDKVPERIVSLSPATTEILFALGLGDKIVGITEFDDYPPEVKDIASVGGFNGPNIEAIAVQKPDIVFASSLSGKANMETLQNLGIPVFMLDAKKLEQIYQSILQIGSITGTQQKSEEMIADMKAKVTSIKNKVSEQPAVKVFYLVDSNGNWTTGKGTFIDELISLAGGENIVNDTEGWVQYSIEKIVEKNPDVIVSAPHAGDIEGIRNMPGYKDTDAVKNDNIFIISDDNIISRASYRIVQGLEEMARYLHPEAFKTLMSD